MSVPEAVLASILAFASTNIDDIFLLLGFFADKKLTPRQVWAGQYLGIGALPATSALCSLLALQIPEGYIRYLGVLPILLGLKRLWDLRKGGGSEANAMSTAAGVLSVASVTIANGADNLAVYIPLMTRLGWTGILVLGAVFAVMTAVWCLGGRWLLTHRPVAALIDRAGHWLMPVVLVGLGLYILFAH